MLIHRFEQQVEKHPAKIAVKTENVSMTYSQLDTLSNRVAHAVNAASTDGGGCFNVGLLMDNAVEMIASILGVLKSGNVYVPMVSDFPAKRLQYIIDHAEIKIFITDNTNKERVLEASRNNGNTRLLFIEDIIGRSPGEKPGSPAKIPDDRDAYILYTSGSTGTPKGVRQTRRNILSFIQRYTENLELTPGDNLTLFSSFSHDASVMDIYTALLNGMTLFPLDLKKEGIFGSLPRWLEENKITVWHSVPTVFRYFLSGLESNGESAPELPGLRYIVLGGEAVLKRDIQRFRHIFSHCRLYNLYGQTESTYNSGQFFDARPGNRGEEITVTLGETVEDACIYVVDDDGDEADALDVGEIVVVADHVSPGYWKDETGTGEKFAEDEDGRVYFTGDLGRRLLDGRIEYLGRKDNQVKIRGFRVETGEIENTVLQYDYIDLAAVLPVQNQSAEIYLACYFSADRDIHLRDLEEFLRERLVDYMVPSYFRQMGKLPVTVSGKIDRNALPKPDLSPGAEYVPPRDELEQKIVDIWADILSVGKEAIGINSNFFQLGGHSLRAALLTSRIHKELNVKVPLASVFDLQTVNGLAGYIRRAEESRYHGIVPAEKREYYPASAIQRQMYFVQQLDPGAIGYNIPYIFVLGDHADRERLAYAFTHLLRRYEILRTGFHVIDGRVVQRIVAYEEIDFAMDYIEGTGDRAPELYREFSRTFDLSRPPLLRAAMFNIDGTYSLAVDFHHIITDNITLNLLEADFVAVHNGTEPPGVALHYKDYALWQNSPPVKQSLKKQEEFWLNTCRGELPVLELPYDFPRPPVQTFGGRASVFVVEEADTQSLKEVARANDSTLYMVLLAAFNVLLSRLGGSEDIIVGAPAAVRGRSELRDMPGMFVNTIPIRTYIKPGTTFRDLLADVRQNTLDAFENREFPFDELVGKLSPNLRRDPSRNPLFDVMFNLLDERHHKAEGLEVNEQIAFDFLRSGSILDLTLTAGDRGGKIVFRNEYSTRLFKPETMERFIDYFKAIISALVKDPEVRLSEIEILPEEEKNRLLVDLNNTGTRYPKDKTVHRLFEEQAEQTPDKTAVVFEDKSLTYYALNEKADALAAYLLSRGVRKGEAVGIMTGPSLEMISAILAILKAGGAYLPINPDYPAERREYLLKDGSVRILITDCEAGNQDREVIAPAEFAPYDGPFTCGPGDSAGDAAYINYTSGSTGTPKGVLVEHRNVVRLVKNTNYMEFREGDRILQTGALEFDASTFEVWGALLNGMELHLVPKEIVLTAEKLKEVLLHRRIHTLWLTSPLFNRMVDEDLEIFQSLSNLLVGGDALSPPHINRVRKVYPRLNMINGYGPTENTTFSTTFAIESEFKGNIPIGKPIANSTVYILDRYSRPVPAGVKGELVVGGDGVARGYLNNPELTNSKFQKPNSKSYVDGPSFNTPLYRTGDRARWLPDPAVRGAYIIEFLGRIDHQVKVRGYRIELGEIENRLLKHDAVKEAVVTTVSDASGDTRLCAYLVAGNVAHDDLREFLSRTLPDYMIPSHMVELDEMPLVPGGKVDRKALPAPDIRTGTEYRPPENNLQVRLVEIWQEVLADDSLKIGINDDFFELGGHSLKATVLVSRIHKLMDVRLPLARVFKTPTVRGLARYIAGAEINRYASIEPVEKTEYYPLSSAQKRLFIIQQMELADTRYNMFYSFSVNKDINTERLETVFKQLIRRHESLRTCFFMKDEAPVQKILDADAVDFSIGAGAIGTAFDLSRAPLLRVCLERVGTEADMLLVEMHHIISDGTSQGILEREFGALYAGEELPPLGLQYKDYSQWQNSGPQQEIMKEREKYWLKEFSGELPVLDLPADFPRPAVQRYEGGVMRFYLNKPLTAALKEFSRQTGTTLYMILLSALNILLHRLSGGEDIVIGTPIAARRHADLRDIIGMFVNTLAIRNYPNGDKSVIHFINEIKTRTLEVYENQEYQFEDLVDKVALKRDTGRHPLFDVMFNFLNLEEDRDDNGGTAPADPDAIEDGGGGKIILDLLFQGKEIGDLIHFTANYCTGIYKAETLRRFIVYFKNIVSGMVENPEIKLSEIEILPLEEKNRLLYDFNDTDAQYPADKTIHGLFEEQAEKTPDRIAIVDKHASITYRELNRISHGVAGLLREKGVGPGRIAAVLMGQSMDMAVVLLGILKSGGAYLPIDPNYPEDRIRYMLNDSEAHLLLKSEIRNSKFETNPNDRNSNDQNEGTPYVVLDFEHLNVLKGCPGQGLVSDLSPSGLAYIIYTSGTTGRPKGVPMEHRGVVNTLNFRKEEYRLGPADTALQLLSYAFDGFVASFFTPLISGTPLVLMDEEGAKDIETIRDVIVDHRVTKFIAVPPLFQAIIETLTGKEASALKTVVLGGDRISPHLLELARQKNKDLEVVNEYGVTEAAVLSTLKRHQESENRVSIGRPIWNTRVYILNPAQRPQPMGVAGELYISGAGLARGYLNNPELTAQRFCPPAGGAFKNRSYKTYKSYRTYNLYKTGDYARRQPSGDIEYLGRIDHQVKIRGYRIELGEIEKQLLAQNAVTEAVVVAREYEDGDKYLCAYFVSGAEVEIETVKSGLSARLPHFMVPAYFKKMEKLPLTPNGKIDREKLPQPGNAPGKTHTPPRNIIEEKLAEIWAGVLNLPYSTVGIDDNFFESGGHSLKATVLTSKIHRELGVKVPLAEIFKTQTIRGLGKVVKGASKEKFIEIRPLPKKEYYELSFNQKRLWIINQKDPENNSFNMSGTFVINERPDEAQIERALVSLLQRHESLRTGFKDVNGNAVQFIVDSGRPRFQSVDISTLEEHRKEARAREIAEQFSRELFSLDRPPLFRVLSVNVEPDLFVLVFCMHHIVSDGWSMEILEKDFFHIYRGDLENPSLESPAPEPDPITPVTYKDFAAWHNRWLEEAPAGKVSREFWIDFLKGELPVLRLPAAPAYLSNPGKKSGAHYRFVIHGDTADALKNLCKSHNITLFTLMYSLYNIFLYNITGQTTVVSSIVNAGRDYASLHTIVGFFVNAVIFKTEIRRDDVFIDFTRDIQASVLEFFKHQNYPLELVLDEVGKPYPDVPASFNMLNTGNSETDTLDNLEPFHNVEAQNVKFDIEPYVLEYRNGIEIIVSYNKNRFKTGYIEQIVENYKKLIEFFAANPYKHLKDYKETKKRRSFLKK